MHQSSTGKMLVDATKTHTLLIRQSTQSSSINSHNMTKNGQLNETAMRLRDSFRGSEPDQTRGPKKRIKVLIIIIVWFKQFILDKEKDAHFQIKHRGKLLEASERFVKPTRGKSHTRRHPCINIKQTDVVTTIVSLGV